MKIFQNRALALILALVVVLGTLAVSAVRFAGACRSREDAFFTASSGKAPVYYVDQIISAAASLADAGEKYEPLYDGAAAVREARKALVRAEDARDISDIYDACVKVRAAAEGFAAAAEAVPMSGYDTELTEDSVSVIAGAFRQIEESTYNVDVQVFNETRYTSFPASLYARLFGIDAPELFAPA